MAGPKRRDWRKKVGKQAGAKASQTKQEKSTPPKLIVLEIGPGESPVVGYYKRSRKKILLDILPLWSKVSKEALRREHPNVESITGNLKSIPLKNNSVSRIECRMPYFTERSPLGIVTAANEMRRVLAPNGEVSITMIDPGVSMPSERRLDKTIDIFEKAGFSLKKIVPVDSTPSLRDRKTYSEKRFDKGLFASVVYIKFKKKPKTGSK